jgi:hypothetical protein
MEDYSKQLKRPEARHRYWHVLKDDRDFFPDANEPFSMKFHGKTFEMKVNHKNDIMTGKLYETYQFLEGHVITVSKKGERLYELEAPDTKPYPKIG